jgi:hypothetical protein
LARLPATLSSFAATVSITSAISFHNGLDKTVTNDIRTGQSDHTNAFDILQFLHGID